MIIEFLIGLPGSGKSTYRNSHGLFTDTIASSDDFIEEYANNHGKTYNDVFSEAIKAANSYFYDVISSDIQKFGSENHKLIIDRTNMTRKSRQKTMTFIKKIALEREVPIEFWAIAFEPPAITWLTRLDRPGKSIPFGVLMSMAKSYEPPDYSEGFRHINFITT